MKPETTTVEYALKPYLEETYGEMIQRLTSGVGGNLFFDEANTRITAGIGGDVVVIDAEHETYRLIIGNKSYELAPFKVTKDGKLFATAATITGSIITGSIISGDITVTGGDAFSKTNDDLDDIDDGSGYSRVATTSITAGKIVLTSGTGVDGSLPVGNTDATVGATFGTNIAGGGTGNNQVGNNGLITIITGGVIQTGAIQSTNWGADAGSEYGLDAGTFRLGGSSSPTLHFDGTNLTIDVGSGDAFSVKSGGNITLEGGGDLILTGADANPAKSIYTGTSDNFEIYVGADGLTWVFDSATDDTFTRNIQHYCRYDVDDRVLWWLSGANGSSRARLHILVGGDSYGYEFEAISLYPVTTAVTDLGKNTNKFKDLYLSGNATIGGDIFLSNGNYIGISAAERLEFYTDGYAAFRGCRVGIGTVLPYESLDVNGNIAIYNEIIFSPLINGNAPGHINHHGYHGGNTQFRDLIISDGKENVLASFEGSTGTSAFTGTVFMSNYGDGDMSFTGGNGTVTTSSDGKEKVVLAEIEDATSMLRQYPNGKYFTWKDKEKHGDRQQFGFVAQEVHAVHPEAAPRTNVKARGEMPGGEQWGLYSKASIALLVQGFKEIEARVTNIERGQK